MGLIQAGVGIAQTAISSMQKTTPMQKYAATSESKLAGQMALQTAQQGASRAERSQFENQLTRQGTATKQMFRNAGLSGVGAAATNIMGIDALNQFAANNASIMRQGRSDYANFASQMQAISDKNVAANNALAMAEAQAQGGAMQAGIGNIIGGVNSTSNAFMKQSAINKYGNIATNANSDLSGGQQQLQALGNNGLQLGNNGLQIGGYGSGNYPLQNQAPAQSYQPSENFYTNFPGAIGFPPQDTQIPQLGGVNGVNQGNWWD